MQSLVVSFVESRPSLSLQMSGAVVEIVFRPIAASSHLFFPETSKYLTIGI